MNIDRTRLLSVARVVVCLPTTATCFDWVDGAEATISANRTQPKVSPPKTGLEFLTPLPGYAQLSSPDDVASRSGFLEKHPHSPWRADLRTGLGLENCNTADYSLAPEAWEKAWPLAMGATVGKGKAIADRAGNELAFMSVPCLISRSQIVPVCSNDEASG